MINSRGYQRFPDNDAFRNSSSRRANIDWHRDLKSLYESIGYTIVDEGELYFTDKGTGDTIDFLKAKSIVQKCSNLITYSNNNTEIKRTGIMLKILGLGEVVKNSQENINEDDNIVLNYKLRAIKYNNLNDRVSITVSTTKFKIKESENWHGDMIFLPLYSKDGEGIRDFIVKEELGGDIHD